MTEQDQILRRFLAEEAPRTRQGRRWLELLHVHQQEIVERYAASPALRRHVGQASREAASLIESLDSDRPRVIGQPVAVPVQAALAELDARGSAALRGATAEIRQDLQAALGQTIRQALGPRQS